MAKKKKVTHEAADLYLALVMFFIVFATVFAVMNFTGIISQAAR
jgi:hypothetical protein